MAQTWREAHRIAQIAAVHAQHDLGLSREGYVDVVLAIRLANIPLMLEPMPRLFGMYFCPASSGPGILVNSGLSMPQLRHTAAHELGHHLLRHGDSIDERIDPWDGQAPEGWSGPEMSAEAFAAWFLMPRPAVLRGLETLGRGRPQNAEDVYRLATLLGSSFRGLCRHLVNLGLASHTDAQAWVRTGRGRLRRHLAGAAADLWHGEIHRLTPEMGDITIHACLDDLIVLPATWEPALIDPPAGLEVVKVESVSGQQPALIDGTALSPTWRVTSDLTETVTLGVTADGDQSRSWSITVQPAYVCSGIDQEWLTAHQDQY